MAGTRTMTRRRLIDTFDEGPIGRSKYPVSSTTSRSRPELLQFDFSMMWRAPAAQQIDDQVAHELVRECNQHQDIHLYRWTEGAVERDDQIPRLSGATNKHNQCTNTFYSKAIYLRLKASRSAISRSTSSSVHRAEFIRSHVGNNLLTFSRSRTSTRRYDVMVTWILLHRR